MNAPGKLRIFNDTLGLALTIAKMAADRQRHGTHKRHSQQCMCLTQCLFCTTETLRDQVMMKQAARMAGKLMEQNKHPVN